MKMKRAHPSVSIAVSGAHQCEGCGRSWFLGQTGGCTQREIAVHRVQQLKFDLIEILQEDG